MVDDVPHSGVVGVARALRVQVRTSGEEVIEGVRDGQASVDALVVDIVLMGPGVLAHAFEATPLVRREVAVAAQAGQDVGLVGVEYAML